MAELAERLRENPGNREEALADLSRLEENLQRHVDPNADARQAALDALVGEARAGKLQVGQAIVRFGRYPYPFIIQVPHVPVQMRSAKEERVAGPIWEGLMLYVADRKELDSVQLSEDAEAYLWDVCDDPDVSLMDRQYNLNLSATAANRAKNELMRKKLVEQYEVNLGRVHKFLEVTDAGYACLKVEPSTSCSSVMLPSLMIRYASS